MRSPKWSGNFVCHNRIIQEGTHLASSIGDAGGSREKDKLRDGNKLLFFSSIVLFESYSSAHVPSVLQHFSLLAIGGPS
ncbi:hypothetical protein GHT06_022331 [Daphnia sinensis]|uniref:Uncharacterized protein n=1 Tax=Daphnia sinensis TaxID=1820382 RepID=A0AAD5KHD8_9CRUS|nr:hypothetical protein GHT06_022331 [Daphnia sinensis]